MCHIVSCWHTGYELWTKHLFKYLICNVSKPEVYVSGKKCKINRSMKTFTRPIKFLKYLSRHNISQCSPSNMFNPIIHNIGISTERIIVIEVYCGFVNNYVIFYTLCNFLFGKNLRHWNKLGESSDRRT